MMPEDIQDAIDYLIDHDGSISLSCDCGEIVNGDDVDFVEAAKLLAEWVKENYK
jgi:hypothetical protein